MPLRESFRRSLPARAWGRRAGLIHSMVTEYGVAYLHGKSVRERAKALIQIAHPKFRGGLIEYCERTVWLQHPQTRPPAVAR